MAKFKSCKKSYFIYVNALLHLVVQRSGHGPMQSDKMSKKSRFYKTTYEIQKKR